MARPPGLFFSRKAAKFLCRQESQRGFLPSCQAKSTLIPLLLNWPSKPVFSCDFIHASFASTTPSFTRRKRLSFMVRHALTFRRLHDRRNLKRLALPDEARQSRVAQQNFECGRATTVFLLAQHLGDHAFE